MDKKIQGGGRGPEIQVNGKINNPIAEKFWSIPIMHKAKETATNLWNKVPETPRKIIEKTGEILFPGDMIQAAAAPLKITKSAKYVTKVLPDGKKITYVQEGVRGASSAAKRKFKNIDKYFEVTPENTIKKDKVVRGLLEEGKSVNPSLENEIFKDITQHKEFLYDKFLK